MEELRFYPGSWLYNALVYGFLRVLKSNGYDVEKVLEGDGTVKLSCEDVEYLKSPPNGDEIREFLAVEERLMEDYEKSVRRSRGSERDRQKKLSKIDGWRDFLSNVADDLLNVPRLLIYYLRAVQKLYGESAVVSLNQNFKTNGQFFPNLFGSSVSSFLDYFKNTLGKMAKWLGGYLELWCRDEKDEYSPDRCLLCDEPVEPEVVKIASDVFGEKRNLVKSFRLFTLSPELFGEKIASWVEGFPNKYWNAENANLVCAKCSVMGLFRYFSMRNVYFINAPSLPVVWYLNELLRSIEDFSRSPSENLASALLNLPLKLLTTLGGWVRQNVEIINLKAFESHSLPAEVIDVLLDSDVQESFKAASEALSVDISNLGMQRGKLKYDDFNKIKESLSPERVLLPNLLNLDTPSLLLEAQKRLVKDRKMKNITLPPNHEAAFQISRLVLSIDRIAKEVKGLGVNVYRLRKLGEEMSDFFDKSKYRLLELVRLGRRADAYHLVLRTYMVAGREFPKDLNEVFTVDDEELFKSYMFSFMSGFKNDSSEEEVEE